ncbi:MAG TPA: ribosome-associated translation inhibitor RaiA [Acidimicrobiia bacterium]|nr:ribosome-associated translation inhibitor RaiA [Acidimicrobiia bacterium]
MDVKMHGRNFQIEDRFRESAASKISRAAKFFDGISSADIEVTEERNPRIADERFRVEITASAAGNVVRVAGAASTPEAALDVTAERLGQQMKKLKGRLITRSRRADNKHLNEQAELVEDSSELEALEIVKVKQFVMKPMTPEEAALQMETLGHDFFFFHSADSDLPTVLYRRRDGAYGLIEPA